MNIRDQCRRLNVQVGDTIEGTEGGPGWWHTARLKLLWLGKETAVWSEVYRSSRHPNWSKPVEAADWTLECRDWRHVGCDASKGGAV